MKFYRKKNTIRKKNPVVNSIETEEKIIAKLLMAACLSPEMKA